MGVYKSYECWFHLKNARLKNIKKNKWFNEEVIEVPNKSSQGMQLISTIQQLPDKDIPPASNLISIMRYTRGLPYL